MSRATKMAKIELDNRQNAAGGKMPVRKSKAIYIPNKKETVQSVLNKAKE